jgi:cell division protein FtsI/penicillin-binding protein 2
MRFKVVKIFFFVAIFLILLRLSFWQLFFADNLTAMAEAQRIDSKELNAPRGKILFADGSILASSQPVYLLFLSPKDIQKKFILESDSESQKLQGFELMKQHHIKIAQTLAPLFWEEDDKNKKRVPPPDIEPPKEATSASEAASQRINELADQKSEEDIKKDEIEKIEKSILDKLGNQELYWVSLNRRVDTVLKNRLERMELIGLGFKQEISRFYPEGSSSAHLLGFVGFNDYGESQGYFGLEGFYNGELQGKKGYVSQEKDALGLPILIGNFNEREAKTGKTLKLSIDRTVQHMAEEKLKKGMQKYKAKGGSVVIMDPETGYILAMAALPSYYPDIAAYFPPDTYGNPIVADAYEPGSTFKVLVMAAGINEGVVQKDTICDNCSKALDIASYKIKNWDDKYRTNPDMTDVIIHSDNTGMVFIGKKLGTQNMLKYLNTFGFGKPAGIDLQDDYSPSMRPEKDWKEIDLATSSFGQGLLVTPLQLVRAVGSIANGGKVMEPRMVTEIEEGGKKIAIQPRVLSNPISSESAAIVRDMMVEAVSQGESKFVKPKGYTVAGKTGTAQIAYEGSYDASKTIASFIGFAPANKPKFVMLVRYVKPESSIYGAETAAPTFMEIAKELFTYYNIPPDKPEELQ